MQRFARRAFSTVRWAETKAGELHGRSVIGSSPGLVWAHGLGGSSLADEQRGLAEILDPRKLERSILRLDLRGHGLSVGVHDASRGPEQYTWNELGKDLRKASAATMSRAFFGGEAMGAAVALDAAVAAAGTGSVDAPPGLVLMRPPEVLAQLLKGEAPEAWRRQLEQGAALLEAQGFQAFENSEAQSSALLDSSKVLYGGGAEELLELRRQAGPVFAEVLRGMAKSEAPGRQLLARLAQREQAMAADAYGVPLKPGCPVLLLALPGDSEHPVAAAEELRSLLPAAELVVAASPEEAKETWPEQIKKFLRKAWMKEFLTKRVMPQ